MYTEENARGRFPLRDILLKAIVVIIFLILIVFIITKLTSSNKESDNKVSSNYDKVFSENLEKMESAAFSYYKKDKLPLEVGDKEELTLRDMVNRNLLEAFTDADGKSCDVNNSYIRLTKNEDDYTLKVNLKCGNKEDYSLMKVGEYDYCRYDICKKDISKETKEDKKEETTKEVEITEPSDNSSNSNIISNTNTNTNTSNSNNTSNNKPQVITMYEYRKVTNPVLSSWSGWSEWQYNNDRIGAVICGVNDANCLKEVQLYSRIEKVGTDKGQPVYGRVHYYSYRTRTLISSGSIDTKWSTYNDVSLLNNGYTYTGNTR